MYEVQEHNQSNALLDFYRELYRKKYGIDPIIQNIAHATTTFKDLVRKVGEGMTRRLVEHYLSQNGSSDWYKRHGHNLVVFQRNIEALSSEIGLKDRQQGGHQPGNGPLMALRSWCPRCQFQFILNTKDASQCHRTLCINCQ